jgi:type I restriction enzyme R subunit
MKNNELIEVLETPNFIVLDKYERNWKHNGKHQSERELELEFIDDLNKLGYDFRGDIKTPNALLFNARVKIEALNEVKFTEGEWKRFLEEYLDKGSEHIVDKSRKIHHDYIYDFKFDDGRLKNIYLVDKLTLSRNKLEVINQLEQEGKHKNIYDVTILVNGLPLVHVELKKRGTAISEAFNQIHRYSKESFNGEHSLFKFVQIFIISNGTDTRYFANTTKRDKNSFDFTMNWATSDNAVIKDLKDFTATFCQKRVLLDVLLNYSVFNKDDVLLIMRPYQIAATERVIWKIRSSFEGKNWGKRESGGYVWHTTGSGKTLTSFKVAQMATNLEFIDKVFFVVDRKDLDFQTMKEYERFAKDSVNGSNSTAELRANIEKDDNKIIVTTIQKLNNLIKGEDDLEIYGKQVVFIFDECHRSQFGEAQRNLRRKFKKFYQFGFTGTPIFVENSSGTETTQGVFGVELHSYVITDAIRDQKVLKFKVDYNTVRAKFRDFQDVEKVEEVEKSGLLHPDRINAVARYILENFNQKTHRIYGGHRGFNAMFAVSSVEMAKLYYEAFKVLQKDVENPLKIATIFSFSANEEQHAIGDIADEGFDVSAMNSSSKEFLSSAIRDYNALFKQNYSVDSFDKYYGDLSKKVKNQDVDLLIVVGMFLTGFDAPTLNTLFVDKNLRYHGLIQAFSRTNRIHDATKSFGNIVTFRDLEQATIDAIRLFCKANTKPILLEKSYKEYMEGFCDATTGEERRGFTQIVADLKNRFPNSNDIKTEEDKKDFTKLFGEYLRVENILQNYDEFVALKGLQDIDMNDAPTLKTFKEKYYLSDEAVEKMSEIDVLSERELQDYRSTYNDIREWLIKEGANKRDDGLLTDWSDVVFEVDLLKSQEVNLDYILKHLFESSKKVKSKEELIENVVRMIRSSMGNRAKEGLIVDFINQTDIDKLASIEDTIEAFCNFANERRKHEEAELIQSENLNAEKARRYIQYSLNSQFVSEDGADLNNILPKISPLNPEHLNVKQRVFQKISNFVEKFKDI